MINRFDGDYFFLSNFYPSPVTMYGEIYPTVEHAFQAAKCFSPADREAIRQASTPGIAKRMGRLATLIHDWDELRVPIMTELVRRKFEGNSQLRYLLLATTPHELIEGNTWGDRFWGVYQGVGENHLGKILMQIREEVNS
jgi:hypothetical protein